MILNCICEQSNLFQIENLIQSGEFKYFNQTFKNISEKLVENFHLKNRSFHEFIQDCLTLIMFLLKRQQNLHDFINILISKYKQKYNT